MITVISYPNNEINFSIDEGDTLLSNERVKYMFVDATETTEDTYIEIVYNGVTTTLNIIDECKFEPLDIVFINKHGAQQILPFFKEMSEKLKVTSKEYEGNNGQPSVGKHQFKRYNVQARESFKINSGFVDEDLNETFKQLLLSDRVWIYKNMIPLNIKTSSFSYKTQKKDRLINYEIEFEYSYNEINNI